MAVDISSVKNGSHHHVFYKLNILLLPPVWVLTFFSQNSEFEVNVHTFILKIKNFDLS